MHDDRGTLQRASLNTMLRLLASAALLIYYKAKELLKDFAFPASRVEAQLRGGAGDGVGVPTPVGPRPRGGFVGLKNAGATCYMNSVLQQLYMIESIREGILAVEGATTDPNEDFSGEEQPDHED
ncbi:hypothetical protein MRX96_047335 [Rhipicephalus microplus]